MMLSEAIRAGAKKRPQTFGKVFKFVRGLGVCSCAIGAAYEALQGHTHPDSYHAGLRRASNHQILEDQPWLCPVPHCYKVEECVVDMMQHLNDDHWWTREAIADWVEKMEADNELRGGLDGNHKQA